MKKDSLTRKEFLILRILLHELSDMSAAQLVAKSDGKLSRHTIYVYLAPMVDKGLLTCSVVKRVGWQRTVELWVKVFRPTVKGKSLYFNRVSERAHLEPPTNEAILPIQDLIFSDRGSVETAKAIQGLITFRFYLRTLAYRIRRAVWKWRRGY
jgi:DNA-binding PadR family transcriptional regulator